MTLSDAQLAGMTAIEGTADPALFLTKEFSKEFSSTSPKRLLGPDENSFVHHGQVHIVLLYHPDVDVGASTLPSDIVQCIQGLYAAHGAVAYVSQARYGIACDTGGGGEGDDTTERTALLSFPEEQVQMTPFVAAATYVTQQSMRQLEHRKQDVVLCEIGNDITQRRGRPVWSQEVQKLLGGQSSSEQPAAAKGRAIDGLVSATETFASYSSLRGPVARYLVHVLDPSSELDLRQQSKPLFNVDAAHDQSDWKHVTTELGEMGVWPVTIALSHSDAANTIPDKALEMHKNIASHLPSSFPASNDLPSILGSAYGLPLYEKSMVLSGLSPAAAQAASTVSGNTLNFISRKRVKKSNGAIAIAPSTAATTSQSSTSSAGPKTDVQGNAVASVPFAQGAHAEKNKQALQKAVFLQQLQQVMMRNLKALKDRQVRDAPTDGTQSQAIDKVKEQLMLHYEALRRDLQMMQNSGKMPDLGASLNALIIIDKEASANALHLGGPSNIPALMSRHRQQHQGNTDKDGEKPPTDLAVDISAKAEQGNPAGMVTAAASTSSASSNSEPAQKRPTGTQAIWAGAISWTIALPNAKRSQAATIVSAQCAPNTNRDNLMLPWPTKVQVSEVQTVSLSALQQYASTNGTPCILFQPQAMTPSNQDPQRPSGVPSQQQNESMYMMLARMIDSKKGCALLKIQGPNTTPDAGIVVIPTAPPGGGSNRRLLGLVFDKPVPWHLFAPQQAQAAKQGGVAPPGTAQLKSSSGAPSAQPASQTTASSSVPLAKGEADEALATAQLNQQLPLWARPQAAAATTAVNAVNIDTQNPEQQQSVNSEGSHQVASQQNVPHTSAPGTWLGASNGKGSNSAMTESVEAPALPGNIDFEALQRMLGLLPS